MSVFVLLTHLFCSCHTERFLRKENFEKFLHPMLSYQVDKLNDGTQTASLSFFNFFRISSLRKKRDNILFLSENAGAIDELYLYHREYVQQSKRLDL